MQRNHFPSRSFEHKARTDRLTQYIIRNPFVTLLAGGLFCVSASPLVMAAVASASGTELTSANEWSEIIERFFTTLAVIGGALAIIQWVYDRHDRAAEVLLKLTELFIDPKLTDGKVAIESEPVKGLAETQKRDVDHVLRFYVLVCGMRAADQVPDTSLSKCFAWWLAYYYRAKSAGLRSYVDECYPTLKKWLREDILQPPECRFFRPHEFWVKRDIAEEFQNCFDDKS
jgi:hypothetical protein